MKKEDITEIEKILVRSEREAALLKAKSLMKAHEEFKKKHPRPKHKKEGDKNEDIKTN